MNKNVTAVFAAVCGLFMASCGTPSDLRPGEKVSVDIVQPGMRGTNNVSDAGEDTGSQTQGTTEQQEVMPNHDQGANTLQPGDSVREEAETNTEAGAVKR